MVYPPRVKENNVRTISPQKTLFNLSICVSLEISKGSRKKSFLFNGRAIKRGGVDYDRPLRNI